METRSRTALLWIGIFLSLVLPAHDRRGFGLSVEVDGSARPVYHQGGKAYIEALRGRDYDLRITNPLGCRVAVALSVDGLNTINASHTDSGSAPKWVLEPYESLVISGWQVNGSEARKFYFTGEKHSYGAWLGQTQNLGVIEAVFFRVRTPPPRPVAPCQPRLEKDSRSPAGEESFGGASGAPAPSAAPPAAKEGKKSAEAQSSGRLSDEYAATGIGERTGHDVEWVHLELEDHPVATLRVRYEFRPQLVQLGILPRDPAPPDPLCRRERARGFEGSYCPDP